MLRAGEGGGAVAVRAALGLGARRARRSAAPRWMLLHALLLTVLLYDLWWSCPGRRSLLHWAEGALAAAALGSLLQQASWLLPPPGPPAAVTRAQLRLLGLRPEDLDSSFHLVDDSVCSAASSLSADDSAAGAGAGAEALSLSLSRSWSSSEGRSPPPSPPSPPPRSPRGFTDDRDEFIADRTSLNDYLKQYVSRQSQAEAEAAALGGGGAGGGGGGAGAGGGGAWLLLPPAPAYRRADLDHESSEREERLLRGGAAEGEAAAWWRLPLAPRHLHQYNLNLRLWLHMTIVARLQRQLAAADEELARRALPAHALGQLGVEQLRALARECGAVRAALPYLAPFRDQRHLLQRLRKLASGACLSNYKWDGAGDATQPSDAEIILHLFMTYMDGQVGGGGGCGGACGGAGACCAPFSSAHVWAGPPAPRPALALHRVGGAGARPPHYVLVHAEHTIDVGRGRNNLLHSLLVFLALAAPPPPPAPPAPAPSPALRRLQLGPAGVNILWVIGR